MEHTKLFLPDGSPVSPFKNCGTSFLHGVHMCLVKDVDPKCFNQYPPIIDFKYQFEQKARLLPKACFSETDCLSAEAFWYSGHFSNDGLPIANIFMPMVLRIGGRVYVTRYAHGAKCFFLYDTNGSADFYWLDERKPPYPVAEIWSAVKMAQEVTNLEQRSKMLHRRV